MTEQLSRDSSEEHPRVRGENLFILVRPRLRLGNIPACAGKTSLLMTPLYIPQEHPRVRGENGFAYSLHEIHSGTSPRARGKLLSMHPGIAFLRNIPACAGKTPKRTGYLTHFSEHPRVRGENGDSFVPTFPHDGTSPRARGKPIISPRAFKTGRNIPACAGKT